MPKWQACWYFYTPPIDVYSNQWKTETKIFIEMEELAMKGFNTSDGYMGLVGGKYILFASEDDYYEYMND